MGGPTASGSLIAPIDLARFTLAYRAIALVPGYAMAVLARPRSDWIERLAFAIPCACTLVVVSGLATALLHLPFTLPTYAALTLPVNLAGAGAMWRKPATARGPRLRGGQTTPAAVGRQRTPAGTAGFQPAQAGHREAGGPSEPRQTTSPDSAPGRWWLVPIGVAIAQAGALILVHARDVVPPGSDVVSHVIWTNLIARSHIFPIALMSSHIGANDGGFYPPVFHALTALMLNAAPMATYRAVLFSVLAAIALLPLALVCYVRTATGSARVAGLAALASLAFEPRPFFVLSLAFYPFIVSLLFAPAIAMALRDGLGHGDRRAVALAAALGVGLFYTHPTELLTAALLALAIGPGLLRGARAWPRACTYVAVVVATWLLAAVPALSAVRHTMAGAQPEIQATHSFAGSAHVDLHWMPALGGPQPLFGRAGGSPGSFDERLYVLRHIDDAQLPPAEVQLIREYHVRHVFYGAGLRAGARWHLNLARLLVDPRPRLVYTSATTCRAGARVTRVMCPMTASYVFHVTEANRSTVKKDVKIL